jgi:glycosyltransferase involved in cell wall biosynthesis
MSEVSVSIVIPTLNGAETLEKCLASIKSNVSQYKYEIIVVDAGSDDGKTITIAREYADEVVDGMPCRINRNKGIEVARGDIICFTDSDCVVPPDWIDALVGGLLTLNDEDKKIVGVGGGNIALLERPCSEELAISKIIRSPLVSFKARNTSLYKDKRQVLHNPPINSALFKWVLKEVGEFREEPGYPEDLDLDIRINERGFKLYYLPSPVVRHKHKASSQEFARQMRDFGRKRVRVNREHPEASRFYHYGPMFLYLMLYSPLFFVPLTLALLNAFYVSLKGKTFQLFSMLLILTLRFYRNYGAGEVEVLFTEKR